jgi:hypothetical protein
VEHPVEIHRIAHRIRAFLRYLNALKRPSYLHASTSRRPYILGFLGHLAVFKYIRSELKLDQIVPISRIAKWKLRKTNMNTINTSQSKNLTKNTEK